MTPLYLPPRLTRKVAAGPMSVKRTVCLSTASICLMNRRSLAPGLTLGSRTRSYEYFTSSAFISLPSWNFTPRRRWKTYSVGDLCSQRSASSGFASSPWSIQTRFS
jgi:hypothetical protein